MSGELRALISGYVWSVLALIVLLWASSPSNAIVAVVWLAAMVIGSAMWLVIVEGKSLVTLVRRGPPSKALRRLEVLAFLAASFALLVIAPTTWPSHLPVDRQGIPITQDGTYFDHLVDIPENTALALILAMAVYAFTIALGRALMIVVDEARRALIGRHVQPRHMT